MEYKTRCKSNTQISVYFCFVIKVDHFNDVIVFFYDERERNFPLRGMTIFCSTYFYRCPAESD